MIIQVKHRPNIVGSIEDEPFETIIVDEAYKFHGRKDVLGYMLVNSDMTHGAWIRTMPQDRKPGHFVEKKRYDKAQRSERTFIMAPKHLFTFFVF